MAFLSFKPMIAFHQFDKSMTNPNLIIAICSAMGFAAVVKLTGCDTHLVSLLTKPLKKLGLFLLPACGLVTAIIAVALPSTAGCSAAVAPTLIPILVRAGFKPAIAAAMIIGGGIAGIQTALDIADAGYEVDIDLPGFKKDEISIELENGYLTVSAAKGLDKDEEDKKGNYIRKERYAGSMSRSFYVGKHVTVEDVHPKYESGILSFSVPKEEAKPVEEKKHYISIEG